MKNCQRKRRDKSGFTLMEVMVVIAIIGILAATAIPSFMAWLPNYKLKSAVQDLFSNMQTAKMAAIRANGNYTISFSSTGNGSYTMTSPGGSSRTISFADYDPNIRLGRPPADGADEVTYTGDDVVFNARGMTDDNDAGVYLKNIKDTYYRVSTLPTGLIRLKKWRGSEWK